MIPAGLGGKVMTALLKVVLKSSVSQLPCHQGVLLHHLQEGIGLLHKKP